MTIIFLRISAILLSLFAVFDSSATQLVFKGLATTQLNLRIIKVEWGDFDGLTLQSDNRVNHHLQCFNNPFYNERISRIEYKNIYGVAMGWFRIDDQKCLQLFEFLRATFEAIDDENPVYLTLDTRDLRVTKIVLPALDPFNSEYPGKTDNDDGVSASLTDLP